MQRANATKNNASSTNTNSSVNSTTSSLSTMKETAMKYAPSAAVANIALIVVIMIIIVLITVYIIQKIRQGDREESKLIEEEYIQLDNGSSIPLVIESSKLPSPAQGTEYTYNFWMYLSDNYDSAAHHKILMYRGERDKTSETGGVGDITISTPGASPIVVLDKNNNKLMIAVATSRVKSPMSISEIFRVKNRRDEKYMTSVVDYVPLQKWVNITIMIIDNMMRIYLDGDIYSIVSTSEIENTPSILMSNTDLVISHPTANVKGFLAGLKYFNHSINQQKIRSIYRTGPSPKRWLQYIGIQKYGVQSPIYKIE